jgi:hypothetical protein
MKWLLVFDSADGDPNVLSKFLPSGNLGNILITSRNPNMRHNVSPNAWEEISEMEKEDSISLFLKACTL